MVNINCFWQINLFSMCQIVIVLCLRFPASMNRRRALFMLKGVVWCFTYIMRPVWAEHFVSLLYLRGMRHINNTLWYFSDKWQRSNTIFNNQICELSSRYHPTSYLTEVWGRIACTSSLYRQYKLLAYIAGKQLVPDNDSNGFWHYCEGSRLIKQKSSSVYKKPWMQVWL